MAQIFQPGPVPDDYAVVITDLGVPTNKHTIETLDFKTADGTQLSSEHKH